MIGIIIAAAGKSERFQAAGGQGNKLNSVLGIQTLFEKTLDNSIRSGLPIHVVTRTENQGVINSCLQFNIPFSLLNSNGLGESIAFGVRNTAHWDGWLIHLADMPYVNSKLFIKVAEELEKWSLVRPVYNKVPAHPVGISAKYRQQLMDLSGDDGAKSILQHHFVYQLDINDENIIRDIDYPTFDDK